MKLVAASLGFALIAVAAIARAAPLEAYGKLPSFETAALSPDGKSLAYVVTDGEKRAIIVKDLASNQFTYRTFAGDSKVRHVQWAGNGHLIILATTTAVPLEVIASRGEYATAIDVDLVRRRAQPVMRATGVQAMNTVLGIPEVRMTETGPVVFVQGVTFVGSVGRRTLFRLDLDRASFKVIRTGSGDTTDWVIGPDGELVGEEMFDGATGRWALKVRGAQGWREAYSTVALNDPPTVLGLGRNGTSVLYRAADEHGASWREARLDDAAPPEPLPLAPGQSPIFSPDDGRLMGYTRLAGDELRYTFFDPEDEKMWRAVTAAFPGSLVALVSASADRRKIVVEVDSPTAGPAYALVDLSTRNATWLGAQYEGVKEADISPRQAVRYKAADGLELSGYLTLPRGRPAKNLPLVVFAHGGPASRDTPGFDWWAQAMASRGYAVLQVNFRGSSGLGDRLLEAGYGQWGRKMQSDLSDGVRFLADQGAIDPKRVCIVGGSYGGYAALAGAALDTGVYRCAVSVAGPSDLRRMVGGSRDASLRYWTRFMGASDARDPKLAEISPAAHADRVAIPVLLIHGKDDTVVPLEQSQIMADALKRAGKPVDFVVQKGADHWLSRGETRLQTLEATMAFLEKNNPPL